MLTCVRARTKRFSAFGLDVRGVGHGWGTSVRLEQSLASRPSASMSEGGMGGGQACVLNKDYLLVMVYCTKLYPISYLCDSDESTQTQFIIVCTLLFLYVHEPV